MLSFLFQWPTGQLYPWLPGDHMQRSCTMLLCRLEKYIKSLLVFVFFPLTYSARVSEVIPTPGCQRVDPNILRSNFLKIRLYVGWIILSDLLIWQFVLTYCVQRGPACFWLIFCLMLAEQFNLLGRLACMLSIVSYSSEIMMGIVLDFISAGKQPSCSVRHPLTSLKKTKKQYTQRTINIFTCTCVCASVAIIECVFPRLFCLFTLFLHNDINQYCA